MTKANTTGKPRADRGGVRLRRQVLEALIMAQADIARHLDLDRLSKAVVDTVQGLVGATHTTVGLVEDRFIVYRALAGPHVPAIRLAVDGESLSALAIRKRQLLRSDDTAADPRVDRTVAQQMGARSMIAAPMVVEGQPLGVLNAFARSPRAFTPSRVRVLELITPFVADAFSRALLFSTIAGR
jgi:GAF domain-containing protein